MTDEAAGELETLEAIVKGCVENWSPTPYLHHSDVPGFLEEIAYQSRHSGARGHELTTIAATDKAFKWPEVMGDAERRELVNRLLIDSGVAVLAGSGIRFVSSDLQAFLAARRIVSRLPRGPRWWSPRTWHLLRPKAGGPDSGVMLFLAALWWRDARSMVERQLRRLLVSGDRETNVLFIDELTRRGLVPGSDIRDYAVEALRREMDKHSGDATRWGAAAAHLRRLEPAVAEADMVARIRSQDPAVTPEGKLVAHDVLARHDEVLAAAELEFLAEHLTGDPRVRIEMGAGIRHRNHALGTRVLRQLADTEDMGEYRADAAIEGHSVTQMCRLLEHMPALSADRCLRLGDAALAADKATALPVVIRFAEAVRSDDTRLKTAELLRKYDKDSALGIADLVAWPDRRNIDSKLRLRAVRLIGAIDPTRRTAELTRFSEDPSAGEPEQYLAAQDIIESDRATAAMIKFGDNGATSHTYRCKAAAAVGRIERGNGARMYISIAQSSGRADRLRLLELARKLDPIQAATELVAMARDRKEEPEDRLKAVEIAAPRLNTTQKAALYTNIADTTSGDHALVAARQVVRLGSTEGQRLMARLADRKRESDQFQLAASHAAGRHGRSTFSRLMRALVAIAEDDAEKPQVRLAAAINVNTYDHVQGQALLKKIANDTNLPQRIRAEARRARGRPR